MENANTGPLAQKGLRSPRQQQQSIEPHVEPFGVQGPVGPQRSHPQETGSVCTPPLKTGFRWVSVLLPGAVISASLAAGALLGQTDTL